MWPIILHITILTNHILYSYLLLFICNLVILKSIMSQKVNVGKYFISMINNPISFCLNNDHEIIKLSVNTFRSSVFLITGVTILAIDFDIFPLKHLKRKTYGIALMDLGVGLFIVCHSFRLIRNNEHVSSERNQYLIDLKKLPIKIYHSLKTNSLLLIIGFTRLALIKITNYKVSVNEYGVHWNFFFSIFFVKVIILVI